MIQEATLQVLAEVGAERVRQDERWGTQRHHPFVWLAILGEEVGEANQAALEHHFENFRDEPSRGKRSLTEYRTELLQCAAVAIAAVESLDAQLEEEQATQGGEEH